MPILLMKTFFFRWRKILHFLEVDQDQRGWTNRGTRFMDKEDFEADWTPCEALLKKSCVPPSYPVFLRMYVLRLPHRDETTEIRSIDTQFLFLTK